MLLWLPATAHCGLEAIGVFPGEDCCESESQSKAGKHSCEDGCTTVEDGAFKTECAKTTAEPPVTDFVLPELSLFLPPLRAVSLHDETVQFRANHLPQFVIRTSLPIRGPSLAS